MITVVHFFVYVDSRIVGFNEEFSNDISKGLEKNWRELPPPKRLSQWIDCATFVFPQNGKVPFCGNTSGQSAHVETQNGTRSTIAILCFHNLAICTFVFPQLWHLTFCVLHMCDTHRLYHDSYSRMFHLASPLRNLTCTTWISGSNSNPISSTSLIMHAKLPLPPAAGHFFSTSSTCGGKVRMCQWLFLCVSHVPRCACCHGRDCRFACVKTIAMCPCIDHFFHVLLSVFTVCLVT